MRTFNYVVIASVLAFASACGGKSTKTEDAAVKDTTTISMSEPTTVPVPQEFPVPEPIKTTFSEKYPTVQNATWSRYQPNDYIDWEWTGWPAMDTADYSVNFRDNNADSWAWYDSDNNWIGTVTTVTDYQGLPEAVNKVIQKDFNGYTITGVDKEYDKKRTAYEIDLTKGSDKAKVLIAESGTVLKKKMVTDGEKTKEKM